MQRALGLLAMTVCAVCSALAQKTGTLLGPPPPSGQQTAMASTLARRDTLFAVLLFDPSATAPARSSAWTATADPTGPNKEAKIQVNVCDIADALCRDSSAISVTLAGPLNSSDDFTELADLSGLVGSARVEAAWTSRTKAGPVYSFSGKFSAPTYAYRDSALLAKRSVDRSAFAVAASAGYRWATAALLAGLGVEQSYRPPTSQNVCTPSAFGPAGTTTCANIVIGAPSSVQRTIASVSGGWTIGGNGALRLTISRDLQHGVTGFDLPVWVIPSAKAGPAGGLRFGYRTDDKRVTVSLFVSAFKL